MKYSRFSKGICRLFFLSSLAICFFGMSMSSVADAPQRADESNSEAVARRFRAEDHWKPDVKALLNVDFHRAVRDDEAYRLVKYNSLAPFPVQYSLLGAVDVFSALLHDEYAAAFRADVALKKSREGEIPDAAGYYDAMQLLVVSLELNGDWERASRVTTRLYGWIPEIPHEETEWFQARRAYAEGEDGALLADVCRILSAYYDLRASDVDDVVARVNAARESFLKKGKVGAASSLPGFLTLEGGRDQKTFEAYKLRDRCALVVFPKLHVAIHPNDELLSAKTAFLTRASFEKFVEILEKEYRLFHEKPEAFKEKTKRFKREPFSYFYIHDSEMDGILAKNALELLRKMKELPY